MEDKDRPLKRRASESPDKATHDDDGTPSSNKRRFILDDDGLAHKRANDHKAVNPLDVLALAAASATPLPVRSRKRVVLLDSTPSPPRNAKHFNLLTGLVSHVDILLQVIKHLPPQTLLNLYSISAPFHYVMDSHFTAFIMAGTRTWAPDGDRYFPWWCYRQLCIEDPALRRARVDRRSVSWEDFHPKPEPNTISKDASDGTDTQTSDPTESPVSIKSESSFETRERLEKLVLSRQSSAAPVPGFRWLKMATYRETVCREIVGWMAAHGHRIPRREGVDALKKLWFLIDVPVNAPRIALIHNTSYFTKETLAVMQLFFIKLDMLYCDPLHAYGGEQCIREMLLAERSLTTLWNFLRGADGTSKLDMLRLWIRHGYKRPQPVRPMNREMHEQYQAKLKMPIMGVPPHLVGRWNYECWGLGKVKLLRPDELVTAEAVRRRLNLQRMYLPYMSYGYLDTDLNPLPGVVRPEDVVVSLIRKKKNRMLKEQDMDKMDVDKKDGENGPRSGGDEVKTVRDWIQARLASAQGVGQA